MASRLEAISSRLEAIALRLEAIALGLEAIALGLEAIPLGLEAIALRLEAVAIGGDLRKDAFLTPRTSPAEACSCWLNMVEQTADPAKHAQS